MRAKHPQQPLSVSEYGAGADVSIHSDDPLGGPIDPGGRVQPEEYQSWLHEQTWPILRDKPYLWGTWLWNGFDFGSTVRREGDTQDINTKGLVTYDRTVRKDAYYFYKANWSAEPAIHINGRRYVDRAYPVVDVRAYSNAPTTALTVGGRKLGTRRNCPDRICVWTGVRLAAGANQIVATGRFAKSTETDRIVWTLGDGAVNSFRVDSGAVVAPVGAARFGSDAFFEGGAAGTADTPGGRGRAPVLAKLEKATNRDVTATYREGDFHYRLPVLPGRYSVKLTFVEPKAAPGTRRFQVLADGRPVLTDFDVAQAAGGALIEVQRALEVMVGQQGLDLHFKPGTGSALVSAVEVTPLR